jgi:hypothetical protein
MPLVMITGNQNGFALLTFEYPFKLVMVRRWTNKVLLLVAFVSIQHLQTNSSTFFKNHHPCFLVQVNNVFQWARHSLLKCDLPKCGARWILKLGSSQIAS